MHEDHDDKGILVAYENFSTGVSLTIRMIPEWMDTSTSLSEQDAEARSAIRNEPSISNYSGLIATYLEPTPGAIAKIVRGQISKSNDESLSGDNKLAKPFADAISVYDKIRYFSHYIGGASSPSRVAGYIGDALQAYEVSGESDTTSMLVKAGVSIAANYMGMQAGAAAATYVALGEPVLAPVTAPVAGAAVYIAVTKAGDWAGDHLAKAASYSVDYAVETVKATFSSISDQYEEAKLRWSDEEFVRQMYQLY